MPGGRPSTFDKTTFESVCQAIETIPKGLKWILDADDDLPQLRTFYLWLENEGEGEELMQRYRRARNRQAELIIDETLEIADDTSQDTKTVGGDENEREVVNSEWIQRSKVRIETRFKLAGKLDSARWGDKVTNEITGKGGGPVQHAVFEFIPVGSDE